MKPFWTVFGAWIAGEGPVVMAVIPGDHSDHKTMTIFDDHGDNIVPFVVTVEADTPGEARLAGRERVLGN